MRKGMVTLGPKEQVPRGNPQLLVPNIKTKQRTAWTAPNQRYQVGKTFIWRLFLLGRIPWESQLIPLTLHLFFGNKYIWSNVLSWLLLRQLRLRLGVLATALDRKDSLAFSSPPWIQSVTKFPVREPVCCEGNYVITASWMSAGRLHLWLRPIIIHTVLRAHPDGSCIWAFQLL